jgi:hypothetical protein
VKESLRQSKIAAPREKTAAPPILLVDVLKNAATGEAANKESSPRFKGVMV